MMLFIRFQAKADTLILCGLYLLFIDVYVPCRASMIKMSLDESIAQHSARSAAVSNSFLLYINFSFTFILLNVFKDIGSPDKVPS